MSLYEVARETPEEEIPRDNRGRGGQDAVAKANGCHGSPVTIRSQVEASEDNPQSEGAWPGDTLILDFQIPKL